MKKRILALLLGVSLLCTFFVQALPIASAAEVTDSGSCGENLTWTLNTDGLLTISGTGEMKDYINAPWNGLVDKINCVVIRNGVTSIGDGAFKGCTGLTSITIPDSVTSIGDSAFFDCTGLTSITIPDSVTSIGSHAFHGCTGLTSITIPDSVTWIYGGTFYGCTGLTSVTIPNSVTWIDNFTFYGCTGLTSVTIPDSVTSIGNGAFDSCTRLTSITIPDSVTSIGDSAFHGCTGLTSITIPDSVTWIGDSAFHGCAGLTSVTIPDSVTIIGRHAFEGCTGLTSITIPDSVTRIGESAFDGCTGLASITVSGGNKTFDSRNNCNGIIETATNTLISGCKNTDIPDSVTRIGGGAFYGCTGLASITIPDSVTSIGASAFWDCTGLTSITIPDSVTSIGYWAFYGCTGLTSITIPDSVTSIGNGAFDGCTGLASITVSGGNKKFDSRNNCNGIIETASNTLISGCKNTDIPDSVTRIGDRAFWGCTGLTSVTIPDSVTSIGDSAFRNCTGLTSITIPDSVTSIGDGAFAYCTGLTSVCFMGDAPVVNESSFQTYDEKFHAYINIPGLTLYYIEGKSGWTTPTWGEEEYPTAVWDGVNIPQPHTHSYTAVVTAPTCTEKGYTTYTCACGDSYKKDFVSALGHDFKDGTCTRCGASDPNYKPVDPTPEATFTDVSETAWYKNSVDYAVEHGLMNGTGTNTFEPESTMTRAMLVTVLWRYAGAPKPGANPFTDVPNGKWYTDAVAWAAENGVVNGVGDGKFEPDGSVTREQMATILYRYAQKVGIDTSKHTELSAFPDANRVSAYARAPMQWIVAEGVIGGSRENGQDWLNPQGNATRAEVATILMRFIENVAKRPQ